MFENFEKNWNNQNILLNKKALKNAKCIYKLFKEKNIIISYIYPSKNDSLVIIIIGDVIEEIQNQKWCKIYCDGDGDISFVLNNGNVWFVLNDFIPLNDSIEKVIKYLKN